MELFDPGSNVADITRLTRRLAAGDEDAFRDFHAAYFDRLYHFLLVVARGKEEEAKEALQQTLLRVVRYARVFSSEEAFWDWLKVVARSAARDAGRKQQRYTGLLARFALLRSPSEPEPVGGADGPMAEALNEGLDQLAPEDRRLLEAKYVQGVTVKELCEQHGQTEKAVESRLLRLRRLIRNHILQRLRNEQV